MGKAIIMRCTAAAASVLMGAIPLVPSCAQAMNLAATIGLKAAMHEADVTQKVPYVCRQGSNGRECFYTSYSNRSGSDNRPSDNGNPYLQRRYTGPSQYQAHPWGAPYGQD
jgi:hypothetical protein